MREVMNLNKNERDQNTDVLLRFVDSTKNIRAFEGKKFDEVFSTEDSKRVFIESLRNNDFLDLMNGINGILRGTKKEEWKMDGDKVALSLDEGNPEYTPPLYEDKPMLLEQVLRAAKGMIKDGRDIEDIAILISSSINAIHPYNDGNGRTSRFAYLLLSEKYDDKLKGNLKLALSDDGRYESIDINPEIIEHKLKAILNEKNGYSNPEINKNNISQIEWESNRLDIKFNIDVIDETKIKLLDMLSDSDYATIALFLYVNEKPDKERYLKFYEPVEWLGRKLPDRNNIMVDVLFKDINQQEAQRIYSLYRQIKIEYIHALIDSISNPNKDEYKFRVKDNESTILEYFKNEILDERKI